MAEQKDPELISSHGYIKITITYRATIYDNEFQATRKKVSTLKDINKEPNETIKRGKDAIKSGLTCLD